MPTSHDAAWLEQLHEKFVEALKSNDAKALGACYTEDAVLLPPGRTIVIGHEAIVAFWSSAERIQDLIFEATDTKAVGENGLREAGNLLITTRGKGRETFNVAAKYMSVWLQVNGVWKLDSTAWNGAARAGAGRRGGRRRAAGKAADGPGGGGGARQGAGGGRAGAGRQGGAGAGAAGPRRGGGAGRQGGRGRPRGE